MTHRYAKADQKNATQLVLPVLLRRDALFENFYGVANHKNSAMIQQGLKNRRETLYYIAGPADVGKTHFACSAMQYFENIGGSACYFALAQLSETSDVDSEDDSVFEGLDGFELVVLDDVDRWLTTASREQALFNLFNQFKITGQQLIMTARSVPAHLDLELADLDSRLKSGLLLSLSPLTDDEKQQVLQEFAIQKGLLLEEDVAAFIIKRGGRTMSALVSVMDVLDHASLVEQRRLTIPFVKKILSW